MGELHLDIIVDRMKREFNVECTTGKPQVAYRETILGNAEAEGKYVKQSGGRGQYGHVRIRVKPIDYSIADEDLPEFIAKHLFERNPFYSKAHYIVDTDQKTTEEVAEEIIQIALRHQ